jgi:hypothetical protein
LNFPALDKEVSEFSARYHGRSQFSKWCLIAKLVVNKERVIQFVRIEEVPVKGIKKHLKSAYRDRSTTGCFEKCVRTSGRVNASLQDEPYSSSPDLSVDIMEQPLLCGDSIAQCCELNTRWKVKMNLSCMTTQDRTPVCEQRRPSPYCGKLCCTIKHTARIWPRQTSIFLFR